MEPTDRRKPLYDDDYTTIIIWDMIIHCSGWDFFSLLLLLFYGINLQSAAPSNSLNPPPARLPASLLLLFFFFFIIIRLLLRIFIRSRGRILWSIIIRLSLSLSTRRR